MDKEKQIEEMAKILCGMKNGCDGCMWDKVHCNERNYAEEIYNADYRKASDVAREIFEDIWRVFDTAIWVQETEIKSSKALGLADVQKFAVRKLAIADMKDYLKIVEKKYTESEKENG